MACDVEALNIEKLGSYSFYQNLQAENSLVNVDMLYSNMRHSDILRQVKFYYSGKIKLIFRIGSYKVTNVKNDWYFYIIKGVR